MLSSKEIPAGGDGEIEVTLKTGHRSGKIRKTIYVYTNVEKNKKIELKIYASLPQYYLPDDSNQGIVQKGIYTSRNKGNINYRIKDPIYRILGPFRILGNK